MTRLTLDLPDASATDELGGALARRFPGASDAGRVVYLQGEIGAGKSSLVRAFLRACGVRGAIRSPTYTLVEIHPVGGTTFVHVDLYRLREGAGIEELGLREYFDAGRVLLIEWPERVAAGLPAPDLWIRLADRGAGRRASLESGTDAGATWLRYLASDERIIPYLFNLT